MTVVPCSVIESVRIDKDQDIIPISVGLYRFFLASGALGRLSKDLYEHLIFTARLQETQTVKANNTYLARGLGVGQAKIKEAKAFLSQAGLIEYVRAREDGGQLGEVYIRLSFLPRATTIAARMGTTDEAAAPEESYRDDLTPSLFDYNDPIDGADDNKIKPETTTGTETDPVVNDGSDGKSLTTGTVYHPVADHTSGDHTHGARRQMLKANNQMLKAKNKGGEAPAQNTLVENWYRRYQEETGINVAPLPEDSRLAEAVAVRMGGTIPDPDIAIDTYFRRYKELGLWYAARRSSRKEGPEAWTPDWCFKTFCARYPDILAAAKTVPASGAVPVAVVVVCPVCGSHYVGGMSACHGCGLEIKDHGNADAVEACRKLYEERAAGYAEATDLSSLFREHLAKRGA